MALLTEGKYVPDFIKWEQDQGYSRSRITVKAGSGSARALTKGMVLAKLVTGTATPAAKSGGNTGDGTCTMDVTTPLRSDAKPGVYRVRFTAAAANNGTFQVIDPNGDIIGVVVMAGGTGTFDGEIKFAIADAGSDDFIVGDGFDITVSALVEKWVQLAPAGTDGSQLAAGILYDDITAADGVDNSGGVAFVRAAIYVSDQLTWPAGITTAQKALAVAQLKALGLIEAAAA